MFNYNIFKNEEGLSKSVLRYFIFHKKDGCYDPSLELRHRGSSNDGHRGSSNKEAYDEDMWFPLVSTASLRWI